MCENLGQNPEPNPGGGGVTKFAAANDEALAFILFFSRFLYSSTNAMQQGKPDRNCERG